MAYAKYTKLSSEDGFEDRVTFDYSSAFTFEERGNQIDKYKSVYSYGLKDESQFSSQRNNSVELTKGSSDRFMWLLVYVGYLVVYVMAFPLLVWFSFKRVRDGEKMVVFRLGHMQKPKGPGLVLVLPMIDKYHKKDVSLRAFSVPPKQIITKDKAIIEVGADIYFQIIDVEKSVTNVQNVDYSTRVLVQTALCSLLAQKDLADIESDRRSIASTLLEKSNSTSVIWGVHITRAELSQIKVLSKPLPKQAPSVMMPPGLFGSLGGAGDSASGGGDGETPGSVTGVPAALAQLASSLADSNGRDQTEAITQAMQALVGPNLVMSAATPGDGTSDNNEESTTSEDNSDTTETTTDKKDEEEMSPDEILAMIRPALCEEMVTKIHATYQFEVTGEGERIFFLNLLDGEGALTEGPDPDGKPTTTLKLTFADLHAMLQGTLKAYQAYLFGQLRISGDLAAALRLDILGSKIRKMEKEKLEAQQQEEKTE